MGETCDELLEHYLEPERNPLSKKQKEMKERFDVAWGFCNQYSKFTAIKLLAKKFDISESTAHKNILEMEKFYGQILNFNKEFKTALYVEKLERIANSALEKGDYGFAVKALEVAAELGDLKNAKGIPQKTGNTSYTLVINSNGKPLHEFTIDGKKALPAGDITNIINAAIDMDQSPDIMLKEFDDYYGEEK